MIGPCSRLTKLFLVLCLFFPAFAFAEPIHVPNASFEDGLADNGLPVGWPSLFSVKEYGREITLSDKRAFKDRYSICINDPSDRVSAGLRSASIPATEGLIYTAQVHAYVESGSGQLYLEFWDDQGERIDRGIASASPTGGWTPVQIAQQAPKGTTSITLLLYAHLANTGVAYYDEVSLEAAEKGTAADPMSIANIPQVQWDFSEAPLGVHSLAEVRAEIPEGRPRLFARPETLQNLRDKRKRSLLVDMVWKEINVQAIVGSVAPLPPEPPNCYPERVFDVTLWREGITIASSVVQNLDALAFGFLISGEQRYADAGKKLLLHVANWDPSGTSSRSINDEVSMRLLYSMSRAYDWLHPVLSPKERALVQECIRERGNDVYRAMRRTGFENTLLDNHLVRTMGFLGQAAIAFMGDFPEAEIWFDYIVGLFLFKYPAFGGDEGGWSQGVSYWQSYISWVLEFLDALHTATGLNLAEKPFFRNTAYFKLYAHPPKSKFGAFGDHADGPPGQGAALVVGRFAQLHKDPALQWYVHEITGMGRVPALPMKDFRGYVWAPESVEAMISPEIPENFPQSRLFADVGWALMNIDMSDSKNNVHVKFKSSPYGSFNHSHAEQNSFMIEAYGSPLAISSGYYPWYGSPHHKTWTWESRSKNTILVDGVGQGVQSINAKGDIRAASFGPQFDYVLGDATQAYQGRVKRFWRHLWFIKPGVIAIFDQLEAGRPATYDWLLHTQQEMEIDAHAQRVRVPADTAEMWTYFVTPKGLEISQTDQFTVLPEDRDAGKALQWHLTANSETADGVGRFFTIMIPRPRAEFAAAAPTVATLAAINGYAAKIRVGDAEQVVAFRDDQSMMEVAGYTTDAAAIAWSDDAFMAIGATRIHEGGRPIFSSDSPVDIGVAWESDEKGSRVLSLQIPAIEKIHVDLTATDAPEEVLVNGVKLAASHWSYANGVINLAVEQ